MRIPALPRRGFLGSMVAGIAAAVPGPGLWRRATPTVAPAPIDAEPAAEPFDCDDPGDEEPHWTNSPGFRADSEALSADHLELIARIKGRGRRTYRIVTSDYLQSQRTGVGLTLAAVVAEEVEDMAGEWFQAEDRAIWEGDLLRAVIRHAPDGSVKAIVLSEPREDDPAQVVFPAVAADA